MPTQNTSITTAKLVLRRLITDWRLISSIFLGIFVATFLMSAAPAYLDALERQSIHGAVDSSVARRGEVFFSVEVASNFVPLEPREIESTDAAHAAAITSHLGPVEAGTQRHLHTPYYQMVLPYEPPPESGTAQSTDGVESESDADDQGSVGQAEATAGPPPSPPETGFLQSYDSLERHIIFLEGGPAADRVMRGTQGPLVEALVSARTAEGFSSVSVGDVIVVAPSVDFPLKVSARIAGIIDASDPEEDYWQGDIDSFLFPQLPNADGEVGPSSPPALGLFVSAGALMSAVGTAFPGATADSTWYTAIDTTVLRTWPKDEMQHRMDSLREEFALTLPDSLSFSGIDIMLARFGRDSFLNSVPLLLLLAVLGVAVLYFLFMIVSYLVPNRESDVALFRSRGTSTWQLFRIYIAEGTALTVVATAIAPLPALLAVRLAGMLPYFHHITGGDPLPVHIGWTPFVAAAIAGILCLTIFVVPAVLGARSGLIVHRLRSSRPPSVPLVQRYYIDILLLAVGGVLFWEIQARGELVSGGLFGQEGINEALLVAPVLFLLTVGLLFFRVFPMFIRYVSGESLTLVHAVTAVTLMVLAAGTGVADLQAGQGASWIPTAAILVGLGAAYWITTRASGKVTIVFWTAVQAALVISFFTLRPPDPDDPAAVFSGSVALAAIVPAQIAFHLLAEFTRRAPVWVSMSLWHMARNPLQYSWLVLLLVLVGGIGTLATTVGATLDRSYEERVLYSVGSDIRVFGLQSHLGRRDGRVERTFGSIPGIDMLSTAFRARGKVGAGTQGLGFSFLAVEIDEFSVWFREDFAPVSLEHALSSLESPKLVAPLLIPTDADRIQIWAKPASFYPLIFLWVVIEDANGRLDTVTMSEFQDVRWTLMSAELPDHLERPLKVVSIQLNEPGFGATGTAGQVIFDDLHAFTAATRETTLLEGFEGAMSWVPIATTAIGSDQVQRVSHDTRTGLGSAEFTFGKETNFGLRGIYRTSGHGYIPVIASRSFAEATGATIGSGLLVSLPASIVPVVVTQIVDYFPTLDPAGGGFLVFNIDSLLPYTDALNPLGDTAVNELFIHASPDVSLGLLQEIDSVMRFQGSAIGVQAELDALSIDPLISAGWRTIVLVAIAVVLFIAALGYVVYLLAFAQRNVGEMGSLRSLGLSRIQTIGLVALEHMVIAIVGLSLGTWAGFQMSRMIVSAVTITDGGGRVLPPFILTTNWALMGPLYAILIVIFMTSLVTLGGRILSVDLRRLSRLEN